MTVTTTNPEHNVLYVPGIGDHYFIYNALQFAGIQYWRRFGLRPNFFPLVWNKNEGYKNKHSRLLSRIDELAAKGHKVSLAGVSAGAGAVLNAYADRPDINGVITIAGKIHRPELIRQERFDKNPDFKASAFRVQESLDKLRQESLLGNVLCVYALGDNVVESLEDSRIEGSPELAVSGIGHRSAVAFGVMQGAPEIAKFLNSRQFND